MVRSGKESLISNTFNTGPQKQFTGVGTKFFWFDTRNLVELKSLEKEVQMHLDLMSAYFLPFCIMFPVQKIF